MPLSQARAFVAAFANVGRMLVPCLAAIAAVLAGGLALVVPALVLMGWRPVTAILVVMLADTVL